MRVSIEGKEYGFIEDSKENKNFKTYNERVSQITKKGKWMCALELKDGSVEYYNL